MAAWHGAELARSRGPAPRLDFAGKRAFGSPDPVTNATPRSEIWGPISCYRAAIHGPSTATSYKCAYHVARNDNLRDSKYVSWETLDYIQISYIYNMREKKNAPIKKRQMLMLIFFINTVSSLYHANSLSTDSIYS